MYRAARLDRRGTRLVGAKIRDDALWIGAFKGQQEGTEHIDAETRYLIGTNSGLTIDSLVRTLKYLWK